MKIKKLTMKAFGSYGTETALDYSDLQNGLYLIRGKTGAGKTTIFDAVMIALYGEASGERRDFAMFHSDFVPKSVDSEVELVFEHKGGTHRVRRVQHFKKTKGTESEYVAVSPEATFWEDGKPVIEKATVVTERIKRLIGLSAAQFRQIVMLAQGDFRKFLDAKSDERGAILRQIFDTSDYRGVTDRLCAAYGTLKDELDKEKKNISVLVGNMTVPADVTEEERAKLNADHPELLSALEGLVARETASADALAKTAKARAEKFNKLNAGRETAKIRNGQLNDLESARRKMAELEGKKEEMGVRASVKETALRALPAKRAMEAATSRADELATQEAKLRDEETKLNDLRQKKEAAEAELQALGYDEESVADLDKELAQLCSLQEDFKKLEENQKAKANLDREIQEKKKRIEDFAAQFKTAKEELKKLNAQLEDLGNPEEKKAKYQAEVGVCDEKLKNLKTLLNNVIEVESSLEKRKSTLLAQAKTLLGEDALTWEELAAGERISAAQSEIEARKDSANTAAGDADVKIKQKSDLRKKVDESTKARDAADNALNAEQSNYNNTLVPRQTELATMITDLEERVKGLGTKEQFGSGLKKKQDDRDQMDAAVKAVANKVQKATDAFIQKNGEVNGLCSALNSLRQKTTDSKADLTACLEKCGYADVFALKADLAGLPPQMDEAWLTGETEALGSYELDLKTTGEVISKLSKETEGCVAVDLEALDDEIGRAKEKAERDTDAANAAKNLRDGHQELLEKVSSSGEKLARTATGFRRLGELVGMVNGGQGQGADRIDFERYMLGANLREVLAMANVRLDIMSGGRYELVHRVEGLNQKTTAGLDIDVLDHVTGARRRAGSFSGGEGFQASMALALGLSDVVKSHAGSAGLDSTFIDEGFGSLDGDVLENCVRVLKDLAGGKRQVGIISHVEKLEEDIWPQIVVESGVHGSSARIEKR